MKATEWVMKLREKRERLRRQEQQGRYATDNEENREDAIESLMFSEARHGEVYGIEGMSCSGKTELLYHLAGNAVIKSPETLILVINSEWDWDQERLIQVVHEKLLRKGKQSGICGCGQEIVDPFSSQVSSSSSDGIEGTVLEPELKEGLHEPIEPRMAEKGKCAIWKHAREILQNQSVMVWPAEFEACLENVPSNAEELVAIWKRLQNQRKEHVPLQFREEKILPDHSEPEAADQGRIPLPDKLADMHLAYVFIDGLSTFYWQLRLERSYGKRYAQLDRKLRTASKMLGCRVVCTNWCLNAKAHLPITYEAFRTERRAHSRFYLEHRRTKLGCLFFSGAKGLTYRKEDEDSQKEQRQ
ncbi:RecA family ATPase Rlp1 [Schizosaccharomyces cryophilus OY26]|uniref:RecA family ATPase Rlp1 n=1 Tax=Schizosaccharomyces cryophilus (strain OY26 / ATCC MYA-4695 / CBS 11777 / NBRC 106824 / NRRL Y48691) TaxID=653667 RepID=S9X9R2_SCHCR|nr:RecA family ATPase Rlp1 [Schizosaccharomyces cryophilus OY26]EPY50506.1 RecA family ATPase Rlp1 [Schizosaccharomyces cryophilus OY26]